MMRMFRLSLFAALVLGVMGLALPEPIAAQSSPTFRVYLTFEDGPSRPYTAEILDILASYNVKATFFPNGYQVPGKEDLVQRVVREGHALGNHMYEEPGFYAGADDDQVRAGFFRSEEIVREALAPTPDLLAIYDAQQKLFRQPGGAAQPFPETPGVNLITYNWHVDSNDCGWFIDPDLDMSLDEQSLENVLGTPRALGGARWNVYQHGDGAVIVFHDINRVTGRVLPTIIETLLVDGATFGVLPRPGDAPGTMPIALGSPPVEGVGVPGVQLLGTLDANANLRATPDANGELVAYNIPAGTAVTLIGRAGDWFQATYDGRTGYIYRPLVMVNSGPIPSLPAVEPAIAVASS